jgi:serine protease
MKKLIMALVAFTLIATTMPAQANLKSKTSSIPTLAIMDTALDTSIPSIKEKLIGEVCIIDKWASCPNGKGFMEGPGSSTLPKAQLATRDMNHGTQMASIAIANNPNMNILFVRIIGNTKAGTTQNTTINTVPNALKWIYENKDKYNIKAVSMSQGHHNLLRKAEYCPVTNTDYWVNWLSKSNIPVFFPSGNGRDYQRIDWPACIPGSVSVGGFEQQINDSTGKMDFWISSNSNYDSKLLDIFAAINSPALFPGGFNGNAYGTSVSTQIAAAKWVQLSQSKPTLTIDQMLSLIKNTGTPITNSNKSNGIIFDLVRAING